jgi:hypothetical protein
VVLVQVAEPGELVVMVVGAQAVQAALVRNIQLFVCVAVLVAIKYANLSPQNLVVLAVLVILGRVTQVLRVLQVLPALLAALLAVFAKRLLALVLVMVGPVGMVVLAVIRGVLAHQ